MVDNLLQGTGQEVSSSNTRNQPARLTLTVGTVYFDTLRAFHQTFAAPVLYANAESEVWEGTLDLTFRLPLEQMLFRGRMRPVFS